MQIKITVNGTDERTAINPRERVSSVRRRMQKKHGYADDPTWQTRKPDGAVLVDSRSFATQGVNENDHLFLSPTVGVNG